MQRIVDAPGQFLPRTRNPPHIDGNALPLGVLAGLRVRGVNLEPAPTIVEVRKSIAGQPPGA
jgi:hypothetical protein